ncbi:uncharacterized protein LOC135209192 [Macrobrachium nipponense]|uniref:uncharacterized protein LOC135209192 n=1 Tax=Macrobrachium nipponense TaxID=159736 RepID=UPI0030C82FD7
MKLLIVLLVVALASAADLRDASDRLVPGSGDLQSLHTGAEETTADLPEVFRILNIIPDGYQDSNHQVLFVNGMRVEVNETISKSSDEGGEDEGALVAQIVIKVIPGAGKSHPAVVEGVSGELPSDIKSRGRREILEYITKVSGNANCVTGAQRITPAGTRLLPENPTANPPQPSALHAHNRVISYEGDTNVNYLGSQPKENPDAEVFDSNLVREEANRFYASRPQPAAYTFHSQPIRSQAIRSQPIRSQLIRSQPIRSQPLRQHSQWGQPIRSQPLRAHEPVYSQPIRSQPIHSQPLRSQPIRSLPLMSQPLRSQPIRSQSYTAPRL